MKNGVGLVLLLFLLVGGSAYAEEEIPLPPTPGAGPNVKMWLPILRAQLEVLSDQEILDAQAKYFRGLYLALKKQGFTDEQAMRIVAAQASSQRSN